MRNAAGATQGITKFKPVRLGAGGFVTGISTSSDGATKVIRTDVYNGYVKGVSDTQWRPLFTSTSLAVGDCPGTAGYTAPTGGLVDSPGCFEAVVAPNDATRLYAVWNARLWKSTNTGASWTHLTGVPDILAQSNSGGQPHNCGRNLAVDPQNKDVFLLGTQNNGLYWSTNGGTTITNVAFATNATNGWQEPSKVACDPTGTVTSTVKQRWFAVKQGTGVYVSTTGPGGTYTLMTGSPTRVLDLVFDANGNCWATDPSLGTQNLWKCAAGGTTWVRQTGAPSLFVVTVAIDPITPARIVALNDTGKAIVSSDGGSTWLAGDVFQTGNYPVAAGTSNLFANAIPWLGLGRGTALFPGIARFDPATSGLLWCSHGLGVSSCTPPTTFGGDVPTGRFDWTDQSLGIEELVANHCLTPPGGNPLFFCWDKPIWKLPTNNLDASPHGYPQCPGSSSSDVQHGWDAAYAADNSNWIAAIVNWSGEFSGYSTDGGASWTRFPTAPPISGAIGGCIGVGNAGNVILVPSNNGQPVYTKNSGSTWTTLPLTGVPSSPVSGFGNAYYNTAKFITYSASDAAFYLYNYGGTSVTAGVYKSTNQGDTWTRVFTGNIISSSDLFRGKLRAVPGQASNLFFCDGAATSGNLMRSTNGGVSWSAVTGVTLVGDYGFGAAAPGQSYPAVYFFGTVGGVQGAYRSDDNFATSPKLLTTFPNNSLDGVSVCTGDLNKYGRVYLGFSGSGFAYGDYDCTLTLS